VKIFSFDPSILNCGWACVSGLYRKDKVIQTDKCSWAYGNWKLQGHSLSAKMQEIVEYIILEVGGINADEGDWCILEWPAFFSSEKGQIAAQMGHTLNLAGLDGYVAGYFRLPWRNFHFITANQWKGSVSKNITWMRFCKVMGIKGVHKVDHNAVDAFMMLHQFCKNKGIIDKVIRMTDANLEIE